MNSPMLPAGVKVTSPTAGKRSVEPRIPGFIIDSFPTHTCICPQGPFRVTLTCNLSNKNVIILAIAAIDDRMTDHLQQQKWKHRTVGGVRHLNEVLPTLPFAGVSNMFHSICYPQQSVSCFRLTVWLRGKAIVFGVTIKSIENDTRKKKKKKRGGT
ncbi:hypothetical protein GW17_00003598 [Ensete ventricosum]|nr:hypothetical protein GW17_00003598 [Ensete ventricosum]RZR80143.1 hypothetical protein BHM03_00006071 [Ensete ventricosum]